MVIEWRYMYGTSMESSFLNLVSSIEFKMTNEGHHYNSVLHTDRDNGKPKGNRQETKRRPTGDNGQESVGVESSFFLWLAW